MAKAKTGNQSVALPNESAGAVTDDEHAKLIRWVNDADDQTLETRNLAEKSRNYYDSVQWTPEEIKKLKGQKQAATVINRIKPKVDSLMGMEAANKTTAKAQPRTPKETKGASAATESVRFVLQDNFYDMQRSDAWENLLIEGTGGPEVIVKPNGDGFKVIIRHIMWDRIIYDPHSRRKDFSDARFLGQVVWMDYDEAVAEYPDAKDVLESMQTGSSTYEDKPRWMDNTRRRVKIVELYHRRTDGDWWYSCFTYGGYCEAPKKSPYLDEEKQTEHPYCFASLFVGREGDRYGATKQLLDIQDEINKRRSKALHLNSVRQIRLERGAVEDVNQVRRELAKPDGIVETTPGMEFEVLKTGDMLAGQFALLSEAKMEIDSIGANSATMGKDKTVQSGVALRQRALTGQTELAPMFKILKHMDIRVYRKVWNRIKQYWKGEMWLRVTDDENNLKFVGLNKPVTRGEQMLQQAQEAGAPPEALQQLQQQLAADPTMQEVVDTSNDIVNMDVDIIMDDAPDTVTQEVEDFQAMAEMVKSGFPLPPEAVIMASPLSNKDKIIKMMKEQPQKLPPEVEKQMQDQQEKLKKLAEENQALKQDQQAEQAKMQMEAQIEQMKMQAADQRAQAELALKRAVQEAELQLERERAEATIALERMKAEAQLQLQGLKMQGDQQAQAQKLEFDQQCRAEDQKAKIDEQAKGEEAPLLQNAMPKFVDSLKEITETFAKAQEDNAKALEDMAKAIANPPKRTITAKSSSGATLSATMQ